MNFPAKCHLSRSVYKLLQHCRRRQSPLVYRTTVAMTASFGRRAVQESWAIVKMTARCALWAVAEIWPFEIIQDGGGRHLEFVRIEKSAIRDPLSQKTSPITKHEVDRMTGCEDVAIWNFSIAAAAILDLFEPVIAPLDPPSPKNPL